MTSNDGEHHSGLKVLLALACFVIVVTGLRAAGELFLPVLLGLFLAVLSLPVLNWLVRKRVPRALAIFLTVGLNLLVLFLVIFIATAATSEFQTEFKEKQKNYATVLQERIASISTAIDDRLNSFRGFLSDTGPSGSSSSGTEAIVTPSVTGETDAEKVDPGVAISEEDIAGTHIPTLSEWFEANKLPKLILDWIGATDAVGRLTSLASKSFFVLIIMVFVLAESNRYAKKVVEVIRVQGPDLRRLQNSSRDIQKYLGIKTVVSALTGILAWVVCLALKIDFPILWGLVAFLFNYVPAIGSIVAAIPPIILALIKGGFWPAAGVLACYLAINIAIGNFLEPMLLGDRFGISTVVVILSVLFWGFIWGPVGMFLAVPLTMVVKVMLDNSADLRWISVMLSKGGLDGPKKRRGRRQLATEAVGGGLSTPAEVPVETKKPKGDLTGNQV
ncbi:MAG: AI-2E family transporter [Verrucomicrobiae bacterium]|nr:AI-2E family transporter [Verrucomicrobiae bacterium]